MKDFEYTQELDVFDLMNVPLVHGWIVSPDTPTAQAIDGKGYNQLQETLILYNEAREHGDSSDLIATGEIISHFLTENASQLTHEGLQKLHSDLDERSISVFFRNNHFSTLVKVGVYAVPRLCVSPGYR